MAASWKAVSGDAVAVFDFKANGEKQINLGLGDALRLVEEYDGKWYRGINLVTGESGIFPCNYAQRQKEDDLVLKELNEVLRDWVAQMKTYFSERRTTDYLKLKSMCELLFNYNRKLNLSGTQEIQKNEIRGAVLFKIEEGRRLLGLDVVVRTPDGQAANETNTPIVQLYQMHRNANASKAAANKAANAKPTPKQPAGGLAVSRSATAMNLSSSGGQATETAQPPMKQLIVNMKSFICAVGEDTELNFFLYQKSKDLVLSDTFQVALTSRGMPMDTKLVNNMKTCFKDIPALVPLGDVFLVCRVMRKGGVQPLKPDKKKKDDKAPPDYRRPVGVATISLSHAGIKRGKEVENTLPIWFPTKDENAFYNMVDLIDKFSKDIDKVPKSSGVVIGFTMLTGSFQQTVLADPQLRQIPVTLPLDIGAEEPMGQVRHDMYFTLKEAEFQSGKAIEVHCSVKDSQGRPVDKCVFAGSSHNPHPKDVFRSYIISGATNPRWEETFCVRVPPQHMTAGLHLLLAFKNVEKKEKDESFGFTKLDLIAPEGTVAKDGAQTLQLFKPGKGVNIFTEKDWYLKEKPSDSGKAKAVLKKDTIKVGLRLASNQFTQNTYLHCLFHWKQVPAAKLLDALGKMTFAPQEEILKFLKEIFDACFAVLDAKVPNAAPQVFSALVFVIDMLIDERRGGTSRHLLDQYLEQHFKGITTAEHFTVALTAYFADYEKKKASELNITLKALEYIFKFIIQSCILAAQLNIQIGPTVKEQLLAFFQQVNGLLRNKTPQFVGAQTMAVKKLAPLMPKLDAVFTPAEQGALSIDFINSIPYNEANKNMNVEKITLFRFLVSSKLFQHQEASVPLLQTMVAHLHTHLTTSPELQEQCTALLLQLIDNLQIAQTQGQEGMVIHLVPLLPTIMNLAQKAGEDTPGAAKEDKPQWSDHTMVLLALFFLMTPQDFMSYYASFTDYSQQKTFLKLTCDLFCKFFTRQVPTFPENWFVMLMFQYSVALKVLIVLASLIQERISIIQDEADIWRSFFRALIEFVNSRALELESFTESKRKLVVDTYNDMRMDVIQVLQVMWQALDAWQSTFVEDMVAPFLSLSTLDHPVLGQIGADLFLTLLHREYAATQAMKTVGSLAIDALDAKYASISATAKEKAKGNLEEQRNYLATFLSERMAGRFEPNDGALGSATQTFIQNMSNYLLLVFDLKSIPEDGPWEDERTTATLQLMDFLKTAGRLEPFKRYIHDLVRQHVTASNWVEAGKTIMLHAALYNWGDLTQEEAMSEDVGKQTRQDRKVGLYKQAIHFYDKAKMWELCIALCTELKTILPTEANDLITQIAAHERNVSTTERFFCEYFRVGYFGKGFPPNLRNKEFIYRGFELERLADFSQRIQSKFPDSKLLTYTDPPPEETLQSDTQNLQVFSVKASFIEEKEGKPHPRVKKEMSAGMQKYYSLNEVDVFLYSKPFRKNKKKGEQPHEEFADLWYKNYFYILKESFPTVYRRGEVIRVDTTETHPIDNATKAIAEKNRELAQLNAKYESGQGGNLAPFTMLLKGVIDAAVSGGTVLYQKAFFSDDFLGANPDKTPDAERLNELLNEQVGFLDSGLKIHAKLCPMEMAALQEDLDVRLIKVKQEVKTQVPTLSELFRKHGGSGNIVLSPCFDNMTASTIGGGAAGGAPAGGPPGSPATARAPGNLQRSLSSGGLNSAALNRSPSSNNFALPGGAAPGGAPGGLPSAATNPGLRPVVVLPAGVVAAGAPSPRLSVNGPIAPQLPAGFRASGQMPAPGAAGGAPPPGSTTNYGSLPPPNPAGMARTASFGQPGAPGGPPSGQPAVVGHPATGPALTVPGGAAPTALPRASLSQSLPPGAAGGPPPANYGSLPPPNPSGGPKGPGAPGAPVVTTAPGALGRPTMSAGPPPATTPGAPANRPTVTGTYPGPGGFPGGPVKGPPGGPVSAPPGTMPGNYGSLPPTNAGGPKGPSGPGMMAPTGNPGGSPMGNPGAPPGGAPPGHYGSLPPPNAAGGPKGPGGAPLGTQTAPAAMGRPTIGPGPGAFPPGAAPPGAMPPGALPPGAAPGIPKGPVVAGAPKLPTNPGSIGISATSSPPGTMPGNYGSLPPLSGAPKLPTNPGSIGISATSGIPKVSTAPAGIRPPMLPPGVGGAPPPGNYGSLPPPNSGKAPPGY